VAVNWAAPDRCAAVAQLQRRLDEEDRVQRECDPHAGFASRMAAYPARAHSGRRYSAAWERAHWSWEAVLAYLAGVQVPRRVDCCGKIGLYHDKLDLGRVNRGKEVVVQVAAAAAQWLISDRGGAELGRRPLTQFSPRTLRQLPLE
jgi:hypothetical protein